MTKHTYKRITYQELKDGTYKNAFIPQDDKFPVTSHLTSSFRDALIACPNNDDDSRTFMNVFVDEEGKEIARDFRFGTRIKAGDRVYGAGTGCGFEVIEEYRKEGLGAELMLNSQKNKEYDFLLYAGITQKVLPMYHKLKYHVFEIPQYYMVRHAKYVFKSLGLKSLLSQGWIMMKKKLYDIPNYIKCQRLKKKFIIKKETIIPEWVSEMTANDGHQFMEVHDREWFQWNLDYNTYGFTEDIQSFYSVFDRNNKPLGFFMTKERLIQKSGPDKGLIRGTIVEWESCDKKLLSEYVINLLAIQTFSRHVDLIFTLACESSTASQLERIGFHKRAPFIVGLKDKSKQLENFGVQNLWRLRYGYTNMIIL